MYKGSDIIGKPVVTYSTGTIVEHIIDIIFDAQNNLVKGFVLDEGGLLSSARFLPFSQIKAIGIDAVTVQDENAIRKVSDEEVIDGSDKKRVAKGTKIMTEDGRDLGTVADVYFNPTNGMVTGYEISGGIFSDLYSGSSYLPAPSVFRMGEDITFVPSETAKLMEEQVGGLQAVMHTAGEKLTDLKDAATEKAQDASQVIQEKAGEVRERATEYVQVQTVDQAIGRRVYQTVRSDNGFILAAQGQIATAALVERVKLEHKEAELVKATNVDTTRALKDKGHAAASDAKSALEAGAEQLKAKATEAWDSVKEKAAGLKGEAASQIEERRIQGALGRPVTRVILDKSDEVILNTGDLITHESIEKARSAEALEALLSSVYTETPTFSQEELKAHPGEVTS